MHPVPRRLLFVVIKGEAGGYSRQRRHPSVRTRQRTLGGGHYWQRPCKPHHGVPTIASNWFSHCEGVML
jgi:hypothetical protein